MASGALQRPIVGGTGSESLSVIMARAQQQATAQSAQILSAANNIAKQRERAGQAAESAAFRLRMEGFQRMEFDQKKKIEDARLSISQDANKRAEQLQPLTVKGMGLDNELKQLDVKMDPLRRQEMRARTQGISLQNQALRAGNEFNEWSKPYRQAVVEAGGTQAEIEVRQNEEVLAGMDRASQDLNSISSLVGSEEYQSAAQVPAMLTGMPVFGGDLAAMGAIKLTGDKMAAALEELKDAAGSQVGKDADVTESYNAALDKIPGLSEERKAQLTVNPPTIYTTPAGMEPTNVQQTIRHTDGSTTTVNFRDLNGQMRDPEEVIARQEALFKHRKATITSEITNLYKERASTASLYSRLLAAKNKANEAAKAKGELDLIDSQIDTAEKEKREVDSALEATIQGIMARYSENTGAGGRGRGTALPQNPGADRVNPLLNGNAGANTFMDSLGDLPPNY